MGKRIIIFSVLGILLISVCVLYFFKENKHQISSVYQAIPLDATFIVDIKDLEKFKTEISNNPFWNDISLSPVFSNFNNQFQLMDSLKRSNPQIKTILSQSLNFLISGHPVGKDNVELLYYFKLDEESDFRQIDHFIKTLEKNKIVYSSHNYEHSTIHDIIFAEKKGENFSYTWSNGMMILSKSSLLVENAVRQLLAQESVLNQKELGEIMKTSGKSSLVNFYINFNYLPRLGLSLAHSRFKSEFNFLKHFGSWLELDLNLKQDILILNGFSCSKLNEPGFETLFKNQKPVKLEIFNKIPLVSNTFAVLGLSNFGQYQKDYQLFLESQGIGQNRKTTIQDLKNNYNIDLIKGFHDIFEQEAGMVVTNITDDTIVNQSYSIIRTKNSEDAEKTLNGFISEYAAKYNQTSNKYVSEIAINKDLKISVYSLPFANVPALLFGEFFSGSQNQYCTLVNNYLVFGNSPNALLKYIVNLAQNSSLGTDLDFNNFSEYFASQSNFFFYNNPSLSGNLYPNYLKQDVIQSLGILPGHFNQMQALVYQFNISDNGLIYNNIFIKYKASSTAGSSKTNWESSIDASMIGKPIILKSFANNPSVILVQDSKNQLYQINNMGRVLWKIKLQEPILSEIFQIDYYKNGKQQILFNTASHMYIIDRKGNAVENFPVNLKVNASNGLALFDYDKNRNYRIFIAGKDQKIYGYDKDGKLLEGWDVKLTESEVTQPVQHFRIEDKDFLVFSDKQRLYILDRKGNEIVKTSGKIIISVNKTALINARSLKEARFVITDTTGLVYSIALDGTIKTLDYGKIPGDHWFDVYDLDGDGVKDFIFTYGKTLKAFSQKNNKELCSITIDPAISFRPGFYEFPGKKYRIGLVNSDKGNIYLYDYTGSLCKGFPIKGNTQFSIEPLNNSENRFNLMVGSNNFLYDYSVQ
jgi:hypothetical protein